MVSLDFPQHYQSKLKPFIKKHKIKSRVIALNDPDSNSWIPKVDDNWTGSIPATVIINNSTYKFYEQTFTKKGLLNELKTFLKDIYENNSFAFYFNYFQCIKSIIHFKGYQIGDMVDNFELQNIDGKMVSLSDYNNSKGVIVVFIVILALTRWLTKIVLLL